MNDRFASSHGLCDATVQILTEEGRIDPTETAGEYLPFLEQLTDADFRTFYRDMVTVRRFDAEATNLQRQGQLALWPPSAGQEGAQVGSAHAARPQDTIFPSYREHVVTMIRGVDPIEIIRVMRCLTKGGWDPTDPKNGNVRLYTLVLATQMLHATGYAMGIAFDGTCGTGDPAADEAVIVYSGDGASSEGDASEALVFAASYQTPQVFFVQNNQWAISVPFSTQSRVPLYQRAGGFGMPGIQIDGNDVLAGYAVTRARMDAARAGQGPSLIEAVTYRMGAHTTSDDPTRYRGLDEEEHWRGRDPIVRLRRLLESRGVGEEWFAGVDEEAADYAADIRRRTLALEAPVAEAIFDHVYSEPHPLMDEQRAWLQRYERSFEADAVASAPEASATSVTGGVPS